MIVLGLGFALLAIFGFVYLLVSHLCLLKEGADTEQKKLSEAAGGALWVAGLPRLSTLLHWAASGNIKNTFRAAKAFYDEYFLTPRGPLKMVRDVFINGWPHLRQDAEYADECIELVVEQALSIDINESYDLVLAKKAGLLEKIWPKLSSLGYVMATHKWRQLGPGIKSLFDELMEENGEVNIAKRVAQASFDMLIKSDVKGAKETADGIVAARARELGWTPPTPAQAAAAATAAAAKTV